MRGTEKKDICSDTNYEKELEDNSRDGLNPLLKTDYQ